MKNYKGVHFSIWIAQKDKRKFKALPEMTFCSLRPDFFYAYIYVWVCVYVVYIYVWVCVYVV